MNPERTDAMFSEILNEHESISSFFDSVFGFLARRTDFYCEITSPSDKIGFPPGVNEQIVLKTRRKWKNNVIKSANEIPVACEKEIITSTDDELATSTDVMAESNQIQHTETRPTFEQSEYYNGSCFTNYCWSQSINEIELGVLLPEHVRTPKHLRVNIDKTSVKIIDQSNQVVIFEATLVRKWKASEAVWSVDLYPIGGKPLNRSLYTCPTPSNSGKSYKRHPPQMTLQANTCKMVNAQ